MHNVKPLVPVLLLDPVSILSLRSSSFASSYESLSASSRHHHHTHRHNLLFQQKLISFPSFLHLKLSQNQMNFSLELRKTGEKIFSVKKETFWQLHSGIEFGTLANGEELFSHPPSTCSNTNNLGCKTNIFTNTNSNANSNTNTNTITNTDKKQIQMQIQRFSQPFNQIQIIWVAIQNNDTFVCSSDIEWS